MSESEPEDSVSRRLTNTEHYCEISKMNTGTIMEWSIKNFKRLLDLNFELTLKSPQFESTHEGISTTGKWHVKLTLKPIYGNETRIGVHFVRSASQFAAYGRLTAGIIDKDKKLMKQVDCFHNFEMNFFESGVDFVKKSELNDDLLPDGHLTVKCYVAMLHLGTGKPIKKVDLTPERFSKFVKYPEFCDAVVECGDKMFKVNKCVLSARSSKFRELFTQKKENNLIKITDMETDVFENLLSYIYSDKIEKASCSIDLANKLLTAADMYCLSELKELCKRCLQQSLCVENLLEVSVAADLYNLEILKELCIKLMLDSGKNIVFSIDAYDFFKNAPRFLLEGVLKQLFDARSSSQGNLAPSEPCSLPLVRDNESLKKFRFPPSGTNSLYVEEHAIAKDKNSTNIQPTTSVGSPGSFATAFKSGTSDTQHKTSVESKSSTNLPKSNELRDGLQTNKFKAIQSVQPVTTSSSGSFNLHSGSNKSQPSRIAQPIATTSPWYFGSRGVSKPKASLRDFGLSLTSTSQSSTIIQPVTTSSPGSFGFFPAFNGNQSCQPATVGILPVFSVGQQSVDNNQSTKK